MTLDKYLAAARHILRTAELLDLKFKKERGSAEAYVAHQEIEQTERVLAILSDSETAMFRSCESLIHSKMTANPAAAESYLNVARYIHQDALLGKMIAEGRGESREADLLRDKMDAHWHGMAQDPEFKIHVDGLEGIHGWIGKGYGIFSGRKDGVQFEK